MYLRVRKKLQECACKYVKVYTLRNTLLLIFHTRSESLKD